VRGNLALIKNMFRRNRVSVCWSLGWLPRCWGLTKHALLKASHNAPGELQTFSNQDSFTGEAKVSSLCLNICKAEFRL